MLRIYSDRQFVKAGQRHVVLLYPFWGQLPEDPRNPASGRYDAYAAHGRELFTLTDLADADLAVLPAPWEDVQKDAAARQLAERFLDVARAAGKPVAVFFWSDSAEALPLADALVFRTSLDRSRRHPTEFAMPAWSEDLLARYLGGQVPLRAKAAVPVVGFCGWAGHTARQAPTGPLAVSLRRRARQGAKRLAVALGVRHYDTTRDRALGLLAASPRVRTNFLLRDRYLGASTILRETQDTSVIRDVRRAFVQNLVDSDYVLCARGVGNYSYRLYETLSCGRIPVFVDTDSVLPYDFAVDWRQYGVWVEEGDLAHIGERVAEFHARLSPLDFVDLQQACRRFWEAWLAPLGFFAHLARHLAGGTGAAPLSTDAARLSDGVRRVG